MKWYQIVALSSPENTVELVEANLETAVLDGPMLHAEVASAIVVVTVTLTVAVAVFSSLPGLVTTSLSMDRAVQRGKREAKTVSWAKQGMAG